MHSWSYCQIGKGTELVPFRDGMGGTMKRTFIKLLAALSLLSVPAIGVVSAGTAGASSGSSFADGTFSGYSGTTPYTTIFAGNSALAPWTVGGNSVDWINNYWTNPSGSLSSLSIDLNGQATGSISQTFDTVSGGTYDVTFQMAGNFDVNNCVNSTTGKYETRTATVSATGGAPMPYMATCSSSWSLSTMGWAPETYQFTASSDSTTLTFNGDPSAYPIYLGPVIADVSVSRVGLGGGMSPSYDRFSVEDTYMNSAVVDTNRPITGTGLLTSWSYYAAQTGGSVSLLVTAPVTVVNNTASSYSANTEVLYVSPFSTPTSTGLNTVLLTTPVKVQAGDELGLYFSGSPVVVDHTYTSPYNNTTCEGSCAFYTSNGSGLPGADTMMTFQGSSTRYYSFSVDGITVPDSPGFSAVATGVGTITVTPTAPSWDGGTSITGYDVFVSTTQGGEVYTNSPACTVDVTSGESSCDVAGLANGTLYYITVEAVNAVGNSSPSNEATATTWYDFSGFYSPIKFGNSSMSPNTAEAGSAVPVQFSLGGVSSLDILSSESPTITLTCPGGTTSPTPTSTSGKSSLTYDPTTDSYTYPWKTSKTWAGCSGTLTLTFSQPVGTNGSTESANFTFR